MTDDQIRAILARVKTIALVGFSANPDRPSHRVARFLVGKGYRVIPVNPGLAGQMFGAEPVVARLADIDGPVDMVDVFRQSDALPGLVVEALARFPDLDVLWTQLGVVHEGAAAQARAAGVTVVQNRCPAIEFPRLFGGQSRADIALV